MTKPGFTLLEMLISVAIFSGLVILILAVFVRTASSQARVSVLREKSEAARSAIGRITNDFQYLYLEKSITLGDGDNNEINRTFKGFFLPTTNFDLAMIRNIPIRLTPSWSINATKLRIPVAEVGAAR
jgi:prepilin-type N-terminal cleavage/methylation domain-containing protein